MQFSPLYDLALIRESVRHLSKFGVNPVLGKYRVLMIPGSGVTSLQLKKLVARFLETNPHVELGIVAFPFASQFPEIQFIEPGENIYSSIHSFHAVVTSAGVTMIEVAFLGFPMAVFVSADNQVAQYEEFKAKNLIFPLGDIREKSFDIGYFSNFLADYDKWCAASKESLSNIDGLGAKRVIDGIITKLHDL
jgi:spore coat polysaccharide biosynthesis predicted glycosyltransferase SpsG